MWRCRLIQTFCIGSQFILILWNLEKVTNIYFLISNLTTTVNTPSIFAILILFPLFQQLPNKIFFFPYTFVIGNFTLHFVKRNFSKAKLRVQFWDFSTTPKHLRQIFPIFFSFIVIFGTPFRCWASLSYVLSMYIRIK